MTSDTNDGTYRFVRRQLHNEDKEKHQYISTMTSAGPTDTSQVRTQRVHSRASTQPHDKDTKQWPERNKKAEWIRQHIKMRKCSCYIASTKPNSENMCQCGYQEKYHDEEVINRPCQEQPSDTAPLKWTSEKHSNSAPTNAFGEIEFVGFIGNNAKFIRVDSKTKIATMLELMIDVWEIERPNFLISVIGGTDNFNMTPRLRNMFRSGLVDVARKKNAWIITEGTHVGVAKHVGEAVKYSRLNSMDQKDIVAIGIAPWGVIQGKQLLEKSEKIQYTIEGKPNEHEMFLTPNHSHYILVDNGSQHETAFGAETALRAELELKCMTSRENDFKPVPVVLLVIDGGLRILKTVKNALSKSIPVVIVEGSGRVANLLAYAFKFAEEYAFPITDNKGKKIKKRKRLSSCQRNKIASDMNNTSHYKTSDNKRAIDDAINEIDDCLEKFELINIFELGSGDQELYKTLLQAILKASESDLVEQLTVALKLNLIDFARSEIITADKRWKPGSLDDIMMSAILSNKVDFVELLLDNGVKIETFLTIGRLLDLYNGELSSKSTFMALLRNLREEKTNTEPTDPISMADVGKLITHLLDDYYLKQYSSDSGNNLKDDAHFENPLLHLLIWAVLNNLQDMAKFFWRKGLDSTAAALLAHALFSAMKKELKNASPNLYEDIEANSGEFMDLATGVLEECYRTNENYTRDLLIGVLKEWEKASCILIAMKTNNQTFICATACQEVFNNVWMGEMTQENGILKLLICMVIPLLIPLCVKFKEYKENKPDAGGNATTDTVQSVSIFGRERTTIEECFEGRSGEYSDEDGQSSVETETPQSGPSPKDSEDEKQGNNKYSDVQISDEGEQAIIDGTSTQSDSSWEPPATSAQMCFKPRRSSSGRGAYSEYPEDGESSSNKALLQKSPSRSKEDSSKCWGTNQRNCEKLRTWCYFRRAKKRISCFYQAPVVHFLSHVISYMAFLCLYSYVLISKFDQNFSVEDVILIVWVVNIFIEEIRQVIATRYIYTQIKPKAYIADLWNITDILMILLFVIGIILKHLPYQDTLEAARAVLGVNLIICFLRLLQMFSLNKELGPKLVMIIRMVRNLSSFFVMLLIFIVAYAIASHAILYPNTEISFNLLRVIFERPYWNIYGELMLDEIEGTNDCTNIVELYRNGTQPRCPTESGKYVVPVLMGMYMLMCNILLLNLLISIFSNTFEEVQGNADKHCCIQRYHQIQDYITRSMFVPPFSFIEVVIEIIVFLKRSMCQSKPEERTSRTNVFLQPFRYEDVRDTLRKWERTIAQDFKSKKTDLKSIDHSVKAITLGLDQLFSKMNALEEQQHALTATIENTRLHSRQTDCMAKSEFSTVDEPGSVTLDQRMDNREEQTSEEYQPGAIRRSSMGSSEGVEVVHFPDKYRLTGGERRRDAFQDYAESLLANLHSFDNNAMDISNTLVNKSVQKYQSQIDRTADSEYSTVDEPVPVSFDPRMDNIEKKTSEEYQPGAIRRSSMGSSEGVEVVHFPDKYRLTGGERRRDAFQDYAESLLANLHSFDNNAMDISNTLVNKSVQKYQSQIDRTADSEYSTVDEPVPVSFDPRMDNIEKKTSEEDQSGAEQASSEESSESVEVVHSPDEYRLTGGERERTIAEDYVDSLLANLESFNTSLNDVTETKIQAMQMQQPTRTAILEEVKKYWSQIDRTAESESNTVNEPGPVTLDQRIDNIEKKTSKEDQSGAEQASSEESSESV